MDQPGRRRMANYRRHIRDEYRWCVKELSIAARFLRVVAEAEILEDPFGSSRSVAGFLGGRAVTLHETQGLITVFHMLDGRTVSFDLVFDTDPLPDWLTNPAGTWFERLDLGE
jgi:hypothetical protein